MVLGNRVVNRISAYLDDAEAMGNAYPLAQNAGKSFQGSIVLGKGFVLDPHEAMKLIEKNPKNKEVLFPYLNGEDLNTNPDQSPSRWVINFFDWPEEKCRKDYPDCFEIVERLVKPDRLRNTYSKNAREKWWLFERLRQELSLAIEPLERVLVHARVTKTHALSFCGNTIVFSDATVVFSYSRKSIFCILQSSLHESGCIPYL